MTRVHSRSVKIRCFMGCNGPDLRMIIRVKNSHVCNETGSAPVWDDIIILVSKQRRDEAGASSAAFGLHQILQDVGF